MPLLTKFTPFGDNKLQTRSDLQKAFLDLIEPVIPGFSEGKAGVCIQYTGAHFDMGAAYLEGFSRLLWGIVPFARGGGHFPYWNIFCEGLINGCDKSHDEYWGDCFDGCQNLVDLAAIGYALAYVPEFIWDPLSDEEKDIVSSYLLSARNCEFWHCNWKFFRLIIDLGLNNVGVEVDSISHNKYLDDIDSMYVQDGWYCDGDPFKIDYYNAFAFQFYSLIYTDLRPSSKNSNMYTSRTKEFALQFQHWFDDNGSNLPFGRSLTYRFASAAFWGIFPALFKDSQELTISWGEMKWLYLKNLQWWSKQPISVLNSSLLSIGYSYPNQFMCENYNSPQSPYWSFKAFSALMMPEDHPFWKAEAVAPILATTAVQRVGGMIFCHSKGNTVALVSGPYHNTVRYQAEKYSKFAYSTRYGFSVENSRNFKDVTMDNMIGFSYDPNSFYVREVNRSWLFDGGLYSEWSPCSDIEVKTWILNRDTYHIRVHEITNNFIKDVNTTEGGFAISSMSSPTGITTTTDSESCLVSNGEDNSLMVDFSSSPRSCHIDKPDPNTNVINSKVLIPHLKGTIPKGSTVVYSCIVFAQPCPGLGLSKLSEFKNVKIPTVADLNSLTSIENLVEVCGS